MFRSIDSQCCVDFPEDNNSAYDRGLRTGASLPLHHPDLNPRAHIKLWGTLPELTGPNSTLLLMRCTMGPDDIRRRK